MLGLLTSLDFQKVDTTIYCIEESKSPEVFPTVTVTGPIKVRYDMTDSPCLDVWQAARMHGRLSAVTWWTLIGPLIITVGRPVCHFTFKIKVK